MTMQCWICVPLYETNTDTSSLHILFH